MCDKCIVLAAHTTIRLPALSKRTLRLFGAVVRTAKRPCFLESLTARYSCVPQVHSRDVGIRMCGTFWEGCLKEADSAGELRVPLPCCLTSYCTSNINCLSHAGGLEVTLRKEGVILAEDNESKFKRLVFCYHCGVLFPAFDRQLQISFMW